MIKLLIFDLDGTLIDSATDITRAVNRLLHQEKLAAQSIETVKASIGEGLRKLLARLIPSYYPDHPDYARLERDFLRYYAEEGVADVKWMPGAEEFFSQWKGARALVTNKNYGPTLQILDCLKLPPNMWSFVAAVDSWSHYKPHPAPLVEAMRRANVKPRETLMIGDGRPDTRAALAAGCWSAAIDFGYTPAALLKELAPDLMVTSYSELATWIASHNQSS